MSLASTPPLAQYSNAPVFNTKAVTHETDVPADTFRAWERRYGIPKPQRTAGGHRLYSERDVAIIRWLRDRTAEGMNISQAILLLANTTSQSETPSDQPLNEPRHFEQIIDDLVNTLVAFDSSTADRILSEAFSLHPFEDVLLFILQPVMIEIGERWHQGEINVAAEHFSTYFVRRKLSVLLGNFQGDPSRGTIIMACAPDELHELGMLLGALFLARRAFHVIYLGAQVPLSDLQEAIQRIKPHLVCLSATLPETAYQLAEETRILHETFPLLLIGYGGRIFNNDPALRDSIHGVYLGHDAREMVAQVSALLTRPPTSTAEL